MLFGFLIYWAAGSLALLIVSAIVPGFRVPVGSVLVIGLVNAALGQALRFVRFPFNILWLGLILLAINCPILLLAPKLARGMRVKSFFPAFWAALVLAMVGVIVRGLGLLQK